LFIAATAHVNGMTVITHNAREFNRIEGLQVEDWQV
jgi:tRNA(fMet)-specific endonuclease VapC